MKTIDYLPRAPKYSTCWYCLSKVEGSHDSETQVRYLCDKHKPLYINWYCNRQSSNKWYFSSIIILLPDQFRLLYPIHNDEQDFYLDEFSLNSFNNFKGSWRSFEGKTFPFEWVLSQTPEKLLSVFQMYRTFS